MDSTPLFRVMYSKELVLKSTPQAKSHVPVPQFKVKQAARVALEAVERVRVKGGDPDDAQLVLSESEIQFGNYRGQTFKWLLEHDVGYTVNILTSHQAERGGGDESSSPLMDNKDALTRYAQRYPAVQRAVSARRVKDGSASRQEQDERLVGFGPHSRMTCRDLYDLADKRYVQSIRGMEVKRSGFGLDLLQKYIALRDQESRDSAGSSSQPPVPKRPRTTSPGVPSSLPAPGPSPGSMPTGMDVDKPAHSKWPESQVPARQKPGQPSARLARTVNPVPLVPKLAARPHLSTKDLQTTVKKLVKPAVPALPPASIEEDDALFVAALCEAESSIVVKPADTLAPAATQPAAPLPSAAPTDDVDLPTGWKRSLPKELHKWVAQVAVGRDKRGYIAVRPSVTSMWLHPPGPRPTYTQPPSAPDAFFQSRLFLWIPFRLWEFKPLCAQPDCRRLRARLTQCGLYKNVRKVLDIDGWYYMATEYLECHRCKRKVSAWSQDVLDELEPAQREQFPAILTHHLSCDKRVFRLMQERTLGNSVSCLYKQLCKQHHLTWRARSIHYLSACRKFQALGLHTATPPPQRVPVPTPQWLLSVYARDVLSRLEEMKAKVTSVYGSILKMDSTKKVTKKLAGAAAETAAWVTNVGNESGQVLISVLTGDEGKGLLPMAAGLVQRYANAGEEPPQLMYVDRDCCSSITGGRSKTANMFPQWNQLVVRLDVWHFMRRFALAVTTESHPLYGLFMGRLSHCIFGWDAGDVALLRQAKRSELAERQRVVSDAEVSSHITAKEMTRHCRRCTRGTQETVRLLEELLETFRKPTDTMGIPLLDRAKVQEIWQSQKRHVECIQDPAGVSLYRKTGELTKGGIVLPVFRCARGTTSLESFHLHLNRFIPGTSANALHFQAYLIEGLTRWNDDRAAAALNMDGVSEICYSGQMQHFHNQLSQEVLGLKLEVDYPLPGEYTGELIGLEYLFSQTEAVLPTDVGRDPDVPDGLGDEQYEVEDEGFEDDVDVNADPTVSLYTLEESLPPPVGQAATSSTSEEPAPTQSDPTDVPWSGQAEQRTVPDSQAAPQEESTPGKQDDDAMGPDGATGYQHVVRLALSLVELCHHAFVTRAQEEEIVALWENLPEGDKCAVSYLQRYKERLTRGRFKAKPSLTSVIPGTDSLKRAMLGSGSAAQWPNSSRLVEAMCIELSRIHPAGRTTAGIKVRRMGLVKRDYDKIRDLVLANPTLKARTKIQLYQLSERTLGEWYKGREKRQELEVLHLSVDQPSVSAIAPEPLPAALGKPLQPAEHQHRPMATLPLPPVTIRQIMETPLVLPATRPPPVQPGLQPIAPQPPVPTVPPATPKVSRSTEWRRNKRQEAAAAAAAQGTPLPTPTTRRAPTCSQCRQPKTIQFGHSQFRRGSMKVHFCSKAEGRSVEEWLDEMRRGGGEPP